MLGRCNLVKGAACGVWHARGGRGAGFAHVHFMALKHRCRVSMAMGHGDQ